MAANREQRAAALASCGAAASGMHLTGYASVFNAPADIGDFTETVMPTAVDRTLSDIASGSADVVLCVDHDVRQILGRTRSGTLKLTKDQHGLKVDADLPNTQLGRDIAELVRRGDAYGMSFCFAVREGGETWRSKRSRLLRDVILEEVSVLTTEPAYPQTSVAMRSRQGRDKRFYYAFTL